MLDIKHNIWLFGHSVLVNNNENSFYLQWQMAMDFLYIYPDNHWMTVYPRPLSVNHVVILILWDRNNYIMSECNLGVEVQWRGKDDVESVLGLGVDTQGNNAVAMHES